MLARFLLRISLDRKAADQGAALAQYKLGLIYLPGHGVPHNKVLAYMRMTLPMF